MSKLLTKLGGAVIGLLALALIATPTAQAVYLVPQGGTGIQTATAGGVILGNGANAFHFTTAGTAGQVLTSNGAGFFPTFQAASGGSSSFSTTSAAYWFTTKTTDQLSEGSTNFYWTNTRFDNRLSATTTLPNLTTLANLGTIKTTLTGILKAASGVLSTATAGIDYESPLTFSTGLTRSTNTVTVNTSQNIATLSNLTSNGLVKTSGSTGALSIGSNGTDYTLITALTCGGSQFLNSVTAAGVFGCGTPAGTTYTGTFPVSVSGSVISFGGLSTSSPIAAGANILYATGVNTIASAATGTIAAGAGVSVTAGQSVIGSGLTITNTGVTSIVAGTGISISGATGAVTITNIGATGAAYPFTPSTDGGIGTSATTTPLEGAAIGLGLDVPVTSWYGIGGKTVLYASSTSHSTAVGINAGGQNATTSSAFAQNSAFGFSALAQDTTGYENAAFGYNAMVANTTGYDNAAFGTYSLSNAIAAIFNTALGYEALQNTTSGSGNTSAGYQSLLSNTTGSNNTVVGIRAGRSVTSGYSNTIVGGHSVLTPTSITSGFGNIGLGENEFFPDATANLQLSIGNLIYGTLPATTTAFALPTTGAIGIATSSPFALLSIHANNGSTNKTLFAIGSSTSGATTTLFSISNTGSIVTSLGSGAVGSNSGTLYANGTSTPTVTAPITYSGTLGQFLSGVSGSFGCTNASAGVTGCLTGTDWSTFNNKQATLSATWPQILTGTTLSFGGLSTTSNLTQGQLPYVTGVNTFGQVATTSVTCTGNATCTAFTAIGASPITINVAAGTAASSTLLGDSNTFSGTLDVFSNPIKIGTLGGLIAGNSGQTYAAATSSIGAGTGLSFSGTSGAQVGGANGTFSVNASQSITTLSNLSTAGSLNNTASGVLYSTATSTPGVTAPIGYSGTLGQFIGGVSGNFTCTNASTGVTGCLTGTDWNTFNAKESALTFATPLIRTANSIAWVGLATTSQPSSSNLLTSNGAAGVYGTATGTISGSTGLSVTAGQSIIGSGLTITNTGVTSNVAGTGVAVSGATGAVTVSLAALAANSLYANGTSASAVPTVISTSTLYGLVQNGKVLAGSNGSIQYVATTTDSCSTGITCTYSAGNNAFSIANGAVTNAMLANSTISGVALGSTLAALTATNATLVFSASYTGTAAQTVGLNLANANTWTALQTFNNATTTLLSATYASSTNAYFGTLNLPGLTGTQCLHEISGVVSGTGSDCGSGGGGVTSVGLSLPTGFIVTNSPVTTTGTLTATFGAGYGIKKPYTWVVSASGGDFTTIQGALDACGTAGGGTILLPDAVYNDGTTALQFKGSNCALFGTNVGTTTINFTGATTLFKSNTASGYVHNEIHRLYIIGDGNVSSVAIDWSDQGHGVIADIETGAVGTSLKLAATTDTTFYNTFQRLDFNDNRAFCVNASSTNAVNGNVFDTIFCGAPANGGVGINLDNSNGNSFNNIYLEPASVTGTKGLVIFDSTKALNGGVWNNTFSNMYIELNGTGIQISASTPGVDGNGIKRNTFINIINESNTADYTLGTSIAANNTFINAMDSNFSDPINTFQQPFGIGTSTRLQAIGNTPYAAFGISAVNANSTKEFVISNSTNREDFSIDNNGNGVFNNTLSILGHFITVIAAAFTPATAGEIGIDTTDNQVKYYSNSAVRVLSPYANLSFTVASSTWGAGTTTSNQVIAPFTGTAQDIQCKTDTGTMNVQLLVNSTKSLPMLNASTTVGTVTFASSNTFSRGDILELDMGTVASSPTINRCTLRNTQSAT